MDTNKIFSEMAQRAHEFAEICRLMQKIPDMPLAAEVKDALDEYAKRLGLPKADPEAWREDLRLRQDAGERFDYFSKPLNRWADGDKWNFDDPKESKEQFRLHDENAWREEYRKKQAAGVKFECFHRGGDLIGQWVSGNYGFNGGNKEDYREVPQEVQKEGDMRIPEASEIRKWADRYYSLWCFVENSLPRDASSDTFDIFRGYARQVNDEIYGVTDKAKEPHAAERALWEAQRDAGTNEVWKWENMKGNWLDLLPNEEPQWMPGHKYRVKPKPVKLTAKIMGWAFGSKTQEWEFFGTPDEYRAECEKYGYAVVSEINEVVEKPKTEKYYFCLMRTKGGSVIPASSLTIEQLKAECDRWGRNIIGDIEEREVTIE